MELEESSLINGHVLARASSEIHQNPSQEVRRAVSDTQIHICSGSCQKLHALCFIASLSRVPSSAGADSGLTFDLSRSLLSFSNGLKLDVRESPQTQDANLCTHSQDVTSAVRFFKILNKGGSHKILK